MEQVDLKWRQRANEAWLVHRDKNSKYFHACASQHRCANQIFNILDGEGVNRDDPVGVENAFVNYFRGILSSSAPQGIEECLQVLPGRVSTEMNQQLLCEVTRDEVSQALLQMAQLKSPRAQRFSSRFLPRSLGYCWG